MIYIRNMRLRAFHGVLPQERIVGNDYIINLAVDYPVMQACVSDDVTDTMNYADAAEVVKEQMAIPSNLIENVAYRICKSLLERFPKAEQVTVDILKVAPPMSVDCDGAGVRVSLNSKK